MIRYITYVIPSLGSLFSTDLGWPRNKSCKWLPDFPTLQGSNHSKVPSWQGICYPYAYCSLLQSWFGSRWNRYLNTEPASQGSCGALGFVPRRDFQPRRYGRSSSNVTESRRDCGSPFGDPDTMPPKLLTKNQISPCSQKILSTLATSAAPGCPEKLVHRTWMITPVYPDW